KLERERNCEVEASVLKDLEVWLTGGGGGVMGGGVVAPPPPPQAARINGANNTKTKGNARLRIRGIKSDKTSSLSSGYPSRLPLISPLIFSNEQIIIIRRRIINFIIMTQIRQ
ncbi:MAG: hypothetical protein L3J05_07790, partial [Robiginitomaculum sp.]|nr:hypothetical protein [Robiginitomaculum sp.]